ncbi:28104_t:CDS:1, partial [Gigaspora margarita]
MIRNDVITKFKIFKAIFNKWTEFQGSLPETLKLKMRSILKAKFEMFEKRLLITKMITITQESHLSITIAN